MGREVGYCGDCGHRVLGNRPHRDGRRYCPDCRPTARVPVAAAPRERPPRPPARRVKESRRRGLLVPLLAAAAVAAIAVGIALGSGGAPPEDPPAPRNPAASAPPPPAPAPAPEDVLARVREIRQADLMFERRAEILRLLQKAGSGEADRLAAEYDQAFEETAARLADFARSEALRHSAREKYAEAIASLDGYPEAFRASRAAGPLEALRRDLERRKAPSVGAPARAVRPPAGVHPLIADRKRPS